MQKAKQCHGMFQYSMICHARYAQINTAMKSFVQWYEYFNWAKDGFYMPFISPFAA